MAVTGLPRSLTTFIGRSEQVSQVSELLATARLVTLSGPGGTGKTRLATAVAEHWDGEGWFIDLVPLAAEQVARAIAAAILGADPRELADPLAAAAMAIGNRSGLLVLDNCEHVVDEVATTAATLLIRCRDLTILATSREHLKIDGEAVFPVPPMTHPDLRELPGPESLMRYDGVALFADRVARVVPDLRIGGAEAALIARIVSKLEGLPLAIELAAARANVLSLEEIDARLADRFALLAGSVRTAVDRHRTLHAAIDWSFSALPGREAVLLARLAIFPASFDLEAVEAVCVDDTDVSKDVPSISAADILELLSGLIQRSFVVADTTATPARYRLLETIREFARERLTDAEATALRIRHRAHWIARTKRIEQDADQAVAARLLRDKASDLLAAASSASMDDALDDLTEILFATREVWSDVWGVRFFDLAERAVNGAIEKRTEAAHLAQGAASVASEFGRYTQGERLHVAARKHEADLTEMPAEYDLAAGWACWSLKDHEGARAYLDRALRASRETGQPLLEAEVLQAMGWVAPDLGEAMALHKDALEILRTHGSAGQRGLTLARMANLAARAHDHEAEMAIIRELYEVGRVVGERVWLLDAGMRETRLLRRTGDLEGAKRVAEMLIAEVNEDTRPRDIAWVWVEAARALLACGEAPRAGAVARDALDRIERSVLPFERADLLCVAAVAAEIGGRSDEALASLMSAYRCVVATEEVFGAEEAESLGRVLLMRGHLRSGVMVIGRSAGARSVPCSRELSLADRIPELAAARDAIGSALYEDLLAAGAALSRREAASLFESALNDLVAGREGDALDLSSTAAIEFSPTETAIAFEGVRVTLPISKGLRFLGLLVEHPGRAMHVAELTAAVDGGAPDVHSDVGLGPMLDERGARQLRARARSLEREIAEARDWADVARVERARVELEAVADRLTASFGLMGRPRPQGEATERLRKAVWNRLQDAMNRVEQVHPRLGSHLRSSVTTGIHCAYVPDPPVTWRVSRKPTTQA